MISGSNSHQCRLGDLNCVINLATSFFIKVKTQTISNHFLISNYVEMLLFHLAVNIGQVRQSAIVALVTDTNLIFPVTVGELFYLIQNFFLLLNFGYHTSFTTTDDFKLAFISWCLILLLCAPFVSFQCSLSGDLRHVLHSISLLLSFFH